MGGLTINFRKVSLTLLFGVMCPAYSATIPTLFITGVRADATLMSHNETGDPHYTLVSVPSGNTSTRAITSAGGFPVPPYEGDNSISRWIGPNSSSLYGVSGIYAYRTRFDFTGFDFSAASITGKWATDNDGFDILLNGNPPGITSPYVGFVSFTSFSITSGFVPGINALEFKANNVGFGPTGLRAEMTGNAEIDYWNEIPVPAAFWLFGSVLIALTLSSRLAPFRQKAT